MNGHTGASTPRLKIALAATAGIALLELAGGIRSGSLALLSDAAHVSMDVVALAIALAAAVQAKRPATHRQTYGFARYEILAALANGGLLTAVTVLIVVEAVRRLFHPEVPAGGVMAVVAAIGLVVNLSVGAMLLQGTHGNLNMRAALLHVGGDALGGIAVVVGGALILLTGAGWIDPVLSILVAGIIVAGIVGITREATDVLLESAPGHAEVPAVRASIVRVEGVVDVHDLHVWTIGSGSHALSAHVVLDDRKLSEASAIMRKIDGAMRDEFAIAHVTVQFECESCEDDTTIVCTQAGVSRIELTGASGSRTSH
ncbi:MAG: conserved rane protein of unknown function [Candidatus Eremiobacteraeota bacterium]|nr:conserved rane protein of unknown function [Candidatus Eremiobacteraeota bacterium]